MGDLCQEKFKLLRPTPRKALRLAASTRVRRRQNTAGPSRANAENLREESVIDLAREDDTDRRRGQDDGDLHQEKNRERHRGEEIETAIDLRPRVDTGEIVREAPAARDAVNRPQRRGSLRNTASGNGVETGGKRIIVQAAKSQRLHPENTVPKRPERKRAEAGPAAARARRIRRRMINARNMAIT